MRITGYCEKCHKIRTVRVTHFRPRVNVQTGVCSPCEVEEDRQRNERWAKQQERRRQK